MKYVYMGLGWILSLVFLAIGIGTLFSSLYGALLFFAISVFVFPPVRKAVYSKTNRKIPTNTRGVIILLSIVTAVIVIAENEKGKQANIAASNARMKVEQEAQALKENVEFFFANEDSVLAALGGLMFACDYKAVLEESKRYQSVESEEIAQLIRQATNKQNVEAILAELKGIPTAQYERNLKLYTQLVALNPSNSSYAEKVQFYSDKAQEAKEQRAAAEAKRKQEQAKARREQQAAAAREEGIERQFSAWNGAHRNLERLIKESMNDPDSFEHVKTLYWDKGSHLIVSTTFRGKNAFGGVVKNMVKAKVSLTGEVLEVLEQY